MQVCGDVPMECNNTGGEADPYTGWLAGWLAGGRVGADRADWICYSSLKIERRVYQEGVHRHSVETLLCRWFVDTRCSFGRHALTRRLILIIIIP